ncbi:MAG TPA: FAD:protein FMN transferase [Verrucomicrobiae bacterium]|nr:FAD:protein FMN transferase [Verrucomicrobiae bacterium]
MNSPSSAAEAVLRVTQSARATVEQDVYKLEFRAMSTPCRVNCHGVEPHVARDFQRAAVAWVAQFEARYSRFIPDSLIGKINAAAGEHWVEADPETDHIFKLCHELFFFTRGSFDPTALPLIRLWNWKQQPPRVPAAEDIRAARELVGWNKIQRRAGGIFLPHHGMALDLGGIGKEYAVDCVTNMAIQRGIQNVLVDFGQDVRVRGHARDKKFWWIGLEEAQQPGKCWTGVAVADQAVATSGDYLRHFEFNGVRYGHILDPRTGYPALNDCRAASVIAPSCAIAGLLATSACILGAKEGMELIDLHPGAAGAITTNHTKIYSRNFHEYIPA